MNQKFLLCCDLDRTLLPNGPQHESPNARRLFRELAQLPAVMLAYVSGRDLVLLQEAIADYELPLPQYAVGDVGSSIYHIDNDRWESLQTWDAQIAPDWNGHKHDEMQQWCTGFAELTLQEPAKQNTFKLSYYTEPGVDWKNLVARLSVRLQEQGVCASIVWSLDEAAGTGLLDILPATATKLHAVRFLMEQTQTPDANLVYAGDSGNDLPVLVSGLQSVLVANAPEEIRKEAKTRLKNKNLSDRLYLARGGFLGMNGNYAAGVLEGVAHFFPERLDWMRTVMSRWQAGVID